MAVDSRECQPGTLDVNPSNPRRINRLKFGAPPRYLETRYRATANSSEVIENMEQKGGLEPPGVQLGNMSVDCK